MWLGGPRQTAAATSEKIDRNIGGADYHMQYSGSADMVADDDEISIEQCRELIDHGVPGIHFYTLNRSPATRRIYRALF